MVRLLRSKDNDTDARNATTPVRAAPPAYASRRLQYQLLMLVFSLMLVIVLMQEAAKPRNWAWMWGEFPAAQEMPAGDDTWDHDAIDTRLSHVPEPSEPLPPGTIYAPAPLEENDNPPQHTPGYLPGVDPERFRAIRDDTTFRRGETAVWYEMLEALATCDERTWDAMKAEPVGFVQLYRQPGVYRGKLVELQGTVRRAKYISDTSENPHVPGYWQCWLRPKGTNHVVVVYSLQMPDGFPTGDRIEEPVRFVGLFFKRWAYLAHDGPRSAPLVLARDGDWTPATAVTPASPPSWKDWLLAVAAVGILATGVVAWVVRQSRTPEHVSRARHGDDLDVSAVAAADRGPAPRDRDVLATRDQRHTSISNDRASE